MITRDTPHSHSRIQMVNKPALVGIVSIRLRFDRESHIDWIWVWV